MMKSGTGSIVSHTGSFTTPSTSIVSEMRAMGTGARGRSASASTTSAPPAWPASPGAAHAATTAPPNAARASRPARPARPRGMHRDAPRRDARRRLIGPAA